jgi:hypothetical protein
MIIREEIEIYAPLPLVWQVFSCLEDWEEWNPVCRSCQYVEGKEMSEGACVSFVVRPFSVPIRISPRVAKCVPAQEIVWEGERLGIHAVHAFTFREEKDKVVLRSEEKFNGPFVGLGRLISLYSQLRQLTRKLLLSVKREAELRFQLIKNYPS